MKRTFIAMTASAALFCACQSGPQKAILNGTLTGVENDTILAVSYPVTFPLTQFGNVRQDTLPLKDGKFSIQTGADSIPTMVSILPKPSGNEMVDMREHIDILLFPGDKVGVNGSMQDYQVTGSDFHTAYSEALQNWEPLEQQIDSITNIAIRMQKDGVPMDSIIRMGKPIADITEQMQVMKADWIRQHLDSEVSLYLLTQMGFELVQELLPQMSEEVKTGRMSTLYNTMDMLLKQVQTQMDAKKAVSEGAMAPDFTLKDIHGDDLSLSSLRGKYVVLDFWGSWCGWCIKGFPEMKKYYSKYKGKMEILGIDCRDTEEKWKAAVEEHKLPWLHVRNGEGDSDISTLYLIEGYPTKIVVDPEGKIAKVVVGEDPAFYTFLDGLFK